MKKILLAILLFSIAIMTLSSQSLLTDNANYKKVKELKRLQVQAYEDADYPEVIRLSGEIDMYTDLLNKEIETQLAAYRARSALTRLKDRLAQASRLNAQKNFPDEFAEGKKLYDQSYNEFNTQKDYVASLATSTRALEILSVIKFIATESSLPAFYVVRLLPGNTDCFWNISDYEFIYSDPWKWKILYEANKSKLPQPDNPDLILPGMILTIPSINGEVRSGTWEDGVIQ